MANREPAPANAEPTPRSETSFFSLRTENRTLRDELENAKGELALLQSQYERSQTLIGFSDRFGISAVLAGTIFDIAVAEGIDPELAFRLVRLESNFNPRAVSSAGALGLAQVMPNTARYFQRDITREGLFDPQTNLRIGFRYLRGLLERYDGDVSLALLAYNRGHNAVSRDLAAGVNPTNGYDRIVMRGYTGNGLVQD